MADVRAYFDIAYQVSQTAFCIPYGFYRVLIRPLPLPVAHPG